MPLALPCGSCPHGSDGMASLLWRWQTAGGKKKILAPSCGNLGQVPCFCENEAFERVLSPTMSATVCLGLRFALWAVFCHRCPSSCQTPKDRGAWPALIVFVGDHRQTPGGLSEGRAAAANRQKLLHRPLGLRALNRPGDYLPSARLTKLVALLWPDASQDQYKVL